MHNACHIAARLPDGGPSARCAALSQRAVFAHESNESSARSHHGLDQGQRSGRAAHIARGCRFGRKVDRFRVVVARVAAHCLCVHRRGALHVAVEPQLSAELPDDLSRVAGEIESENCVGIDGNSDRSDKVYLYIEDNW